MSDFWPVGFELNDTQSPMQILKGAQDEWCARSDGALLLVLRRSKSQDGNDMIVVDAQYVPSNRTATLFDVVHRPGVPYPVTIQPKGTDLPDFLKRSYNRPGLAIIPQLANVLTQDQHVTNEWVADTPSEFRSKLTKAFNLGTTKSEILNLVSGSLPAPEPSEDQAGEGEANNQ